MPAIIPMMATVIINSINVKPFCLFMANIPRKFLETPAHAGSLIA